MAIRMTTAFVRKARYTLNPHKALLASAQLGSTLLTLNLDLLIITYMQSVLVCIPSMRPMC